MRNHQRAYLSSSIPVGGVGDTVGVNVGLELGFTVKKKTFSTSGLSKSIIKPVGLVVGDVVGVSKYHIQCTLGHTALAHNTCRG